MEQELAALEQKLDLLLAQRAQLRAENSDLRTRVGELESENQRLNNKVGAATARIEAALAMLPEKMESES